MTLGISSDHLSEFSHFAGLTVNFGSWPTRVSAKWLIASMMIFGVVFFIAAANALRASPLPCFLGTRAQNSSKSEGILLFLASGFESFLSFVPLVFRRCLGFWWAAILIFLVITDSYDIYACFSVDGNCLLFFEAFEEAD